MKIETEKRCLAWGCEFRDHCAMHIEEAQFLEHILWFQPVRVGQSCDVFKMRADEQLAEVK